MLKLTGNDVTNISLVDGLGNIKSQSIEHSISLKRVDTVKPVYKVYIPKTNVSALSPYFDTDPVTTETTTPTVHKGSALAFGVSDPTNWSGDVNSWESFWSEFFANETNVAGCDDLPVEGTSVGAISLYKLEQKQRTLYGIVASLSSTDTDLGNGVEGDNVTDFSLSSLAVGDYVVSYIKNGDNDALEVRDDIVTANAETDSSIRKPTEEAALAVPPVSGSLWFTKTENGVSGEETYTYDEDVQNIVLTLGTDKLTINKVAESGQTIVIKVAKITTELKDDWSEIYTDRKDTPSIVAKVDFGNDGYNKNHVQKNASLTRTSEFMNGLRIALKYDVDEVRFIAIGTLKPSTGEVTISNSLVVNNIKDKDIVNQNENAALINQITGGSQEIIDVNCKTINKSEDSSTIINWNTDAAEIKELHPVDENGNKIQNIVPGTVRLQTSEIVDAFGTDDPQEEGCVILADKPVVEITDNYGFTRLVLDQDSATSNGVLNRFRSTSILEKDATEEKVFFEKEAYSVGKVFYNTGVIELNEAVPVIAGTAPSLKYVANGMLNLKATIKDKGTDGNKYSFKVSKDHTEQNGDVIYNIALVLNGTELDVVKCSSNIEGSVVEGTDVSGNVVDVEVPYIGSIDHDVFNTSFIGDDNDLKSLHDGTYDFTDGTDGVDGITASDYIGHKDDSGVTGAWLFDDVKYPAQMWPSLGYTDKEFYMAAQQIAWNRKDTTCVWDVPKGYSKKSAIAYREDGIIPTEWWTEMYYNWCNDIYNGVVVELPPSYYVTKNSLASYKVNGTWYPVAGKDRGTIDAISVINQVPAKLDRDDFITHNINPIYDTGTQGIQIYGNETLNAQYTDLSAAHIARTLTYIRYQTDSYTETLKFELNDVMLWRTWLDYVGTKILEPIKAARGLQWYRVSMGLDTTTAAERANRIVRGIVELQFTPDAEIFKLDYIVYSSAADNTTF